VHVLGALPLRNASRLWGYLNSFELPIWFRPYGFRFYAFVFGCNLDEIEHADLTRYASLGDFFYRKLKDGVRPVDNAVLVTYRPCPFHETCVLINFTRFQVSPADGKVLHFGTIKDLRVEQVKGITYSLDALLGVEQHIPGTPPSNSTVVRLPPNPDHSIVDDQEFANVNGIEYSLDQLLGTSEPSTPGDGTPTSSSPKPRPPKDPDHPPPTKHGEQIDASVEQEGTVADTLAREASVALEMGVRSSLGTRRRSTSGMTVKEGNSLFFTVIYLAPGDYHRFHSPTAWVVEKRRHFMGKSYFLVNFGL
jgi:phosphatidylserine decarboxylase